MTSSPSYEFFMSVMIICGVSTIGGCSTLTPAPALPATATGTTVSTKTPAPSASITLTPNSSPTPYTGPNILFYIQDDNRLFSVYSDGSNQRAIAQGGQFSISPNKKRLVYRTAETYGSNNDEVVILDLSQEEIIYRWNIPGYCEGVFKSSEFAWSPDSQRIAFTLIRYDGVDPVPNCELQYNYEDMGIYQIDLISAKITHPPLIDTFLDLHNYPLLYSPDGSKLRLGAYGEVYDVETWEKIELGLRPLYYTVQLCDEPEKIGRCNGSNLCLYDQNNQISKVLTEYRSYPEISVQSSEFIDTFQLFSNCSGVVYETKRSWMPSLTPQANAELVPLVKVLHFMSLNVENDKVIGTDIWEYILRPDNNKIVLCQRNRFIEEINIFVVNSDGSNKHLIAKFEQRHAPIFGPLFVISPTGEKVAFVNREGIAIVDLDGHNLTQLVHLPDGAPTDKISLEILDWH